MKKKEFSKNLIEFIKESTCSYTCVNLIKKKLKDNGFIELNEENVWNIKGNKFYIIRNDASIIAIELPDNKAEYFEIITTHLDTPSLLLKPEGAYINENYLKYNVMPYGGLLNYGWLDHPLSLAGRIIVNENNTLKSKIVDFKEPLLIIPSVAIHQNSLANTNLDLNMHLDMQPILGLSKDKNDFYKIIEKNVKSKFVDYDLFAYNNTLPALIGINNEILISPRIDNLTSVYGSLISFLEASSVNIKVFCSFNNEEIGSLTEEGADSNFLIDILKRFASNLEIDIASFLAKSFIISSDNTHAVHPNHPEYADDTGAAMLGKGFTIIKEEASTTNALSSSVIKTLCDKNKIKYQISTAKNDIAGGSTLSSISLRHVSVLSIDVGIPQLSMHSSFETCSINDVFELYKMFKAFYESKIIKTNNNIKIDTKK